jgi:hypothetical protein
MGRDFITIVIRPVDEACNFACTYCDAAQYSGGEARMADRVLEEIIRKQVFRVFDSLAFVGMASLLRADLQGRGGKFLEARIIPKRIEHRIELEQRGSERHLSQGATGRYQE